MAQDTKHQYPCNGKACAACEYELQRRDQAADDYRNGRINATELTAIVKPDYTRKVQHQIGYDATWSD